MIIVKPPTSRATFLCPITFLCAAEIRGPVKSVVWPEIFLRIDYALHSLARSHYSEEQGMPDRAIERPFVFRNLPPNGKVLDVGCTGSDLALVLAGFGYDVVGIDARPYQMLRPPFRFVRGDIRKTEFPDGFFDVVTAVSTIEHIGLSGRYGSDEDSEGDSRAMQEIQRILKQGARAIVTVPFGEPAVLRPWNRIYGSEGLRSLARGFIAVKSEFFAPDERGLYRMVDEKEASKYRAVANVGSGRVLQYSYALGCMVLEKP